MLERPVRNDEAAIECLIGEAAAHGAAELASRHHQLCCVAADPCTAAQLRLPVAYVTAPGHETRS